MTAEALLSALIAAAVLLSIPAEPVGQEPGPADVRVPVTADDRLAAITEPTAVDYIIHRFYDEGLPVIRTALAVSFWESRWDTEAQNPKSSAAGLFQILKGTWRRNDCGDRGLRYDAAANADCAYKIWDNDRRRWKQWSVFNEAVEPGRQVKVCPNDPFCLMRNSRNRRVAAAYIEAADALSRWFPG